MIANGGTAHQKTSFAINAHILSRSIRRRWVGDYLVTTTTGLDNDDTDAHGSTPDGQEAICRRVSVKTQGLGEEPLKFSFSFPLQRDSGQIKNKKKQKKMNSAEENSKPRTETTHAYINTNTNTYTHSHDHTYTRI
jgi:hypothetical protein